MAIIVDAIYTDPASFSQIAAGIVGLPVGQSVNNLNFLLTPSVLANSQIINAAPTATTITAVNAKSLTGTAVNLVLPAITPAANGAGITLTGMALSQGAISNVVDSEAITVKQIVITGAAGAALETGVYTWTGLDITTPAQAANAAANMAYGLKITGGAVGGAAGARQYGSYISMAAGTDQAIYVSQGYSYFGGHIGLKVAPDASYGLYYTESFVLADNVSKRGLHSEIYASKTSEYTSMIAGLSSITGVLAANTGNWTEECGVTGIYSKILTEAGSTGTVTFGANYRTCTDFGNGVAFTSFAGLFVGSPTGTVTKVTNLYGVYIGDQTGSTGQAYSIYAAGTPWVYFGGHLGVRSAPSADYGIIYTEALTLADNNNRYGVSGELTGVKTAAAYTGTMYGLSGFASLGAANTQNWTNAYAGLLAVQGRITTIAGSTGTVTWATNFYASTTIANAATITNWAGLYVGVPTTTPSKITNAYGIYVEAIAGAATLNYALYLAGGLAHLEDGVRMLVTPSVTAASQSLNPVPTANTLTAANTATFMAIGQNIAIPAIVPVANGGGITMTGLRLSQGAISNIADSEAITIRQIWISGAAGAALETGIYTWAGVDIAMPAQAANSANNLAFGVRITGGAKAGGASAAQTGIQIAMASATDYALECYTGRAYFGGNLILADGATIGQAAGPLLTFNDTSNYLLISGCTVGIGITVPLGDLHISSATCAEYLQRDSADAVAPQLVFMKSRGTAAVPLIVQDGDNIGALVGQAYVGNSYSNSAYLLLSVDGVPTVNQRAPSRWEFWTTIVNGTITKQLQIRGAGNVEVVSCLLNGGGTAAFNIYGNALVTDATGRDIILSVLDVTNDAWRTMIQMQPIAGALSAACKLGLYGVTPVVQPTGVAAQKVNYATPDLDTEAEIITAFNTTNAAINTIRTALNALGVTTTV